MCVDTEKKIPHSLIGFNKNPIFKQTFQLCRREGGKKNTISTPNQKAISKNHFPIPVLSTKQCKRTQIARKWVNKFNKNKFNKRKGKLYKPIPIQQSRREIFNI